MAKPFAKNFYGSSAWRDCRQGYAAYRGHLCERCLRRGILSHGEIVHHKIELTPDNIDDPNITLSWDNLELLCRFCHAEVHDQRKKCRRYSIGPDGEIIIETPPRCRRKWRPAIDRRVNFRITQFSHEKERDGHKRGEHGRR